MLPMARMRSDVLAGAAPVTERTCPGEQSIGFKPALSLVWEETVGTTSGRQPAATVEHGRLKEARMNDVPGGKLGAVSDLGATV